MAASESGNDDLIDVIVGQWRAMRPDLDPSPIEVLGRLHRAYLRYQTLLSSLLRSYGLNAAAFDVLVTLRRSGEPYRMSARDLSDVSMLTSAGVTLRLDRLEQSGHIVRERSADDRRIVYSRLTDAGLALINQILSEHLANEERMLAGMTQAERRRLAKLLRALERSLEAAEREGPG
jgi:DNA-binding MarR family transcriptional regulator